MKKLILIAALMLILQLPAQAHRQLIIPPLPNENQIAIVVLSKPETEQQIRQLLAPYKDLKLRRIFHEALDGFSVEGNSETLRQLAEAQKQTITVSLVNQYTAETEEGVKIIGGEEVRRFFDSKNQRLTGKGITVGVIDTGVDYTHPDLRRNFGGGHDLVDNDKDPMETLAAQGRATLHGTHVAGIIAANGRIQGVAPEAKIIAYRALGPGGGGTTEQVIAAIEQAIKDKVDVLNLSLGNDINGPDLPISLALNSAVNKGIVAVAANGNSGPGLWTVGSPGTASLAISVGASTPSMETPYLLIEGKRYQINQMEGSAKWNFNGSLEMVDGGIGLKEQLQNVNGKIALIKRGKITFTQKAGNAKTAGAAAVVIYNNVSGSFMGNLQSRIDIPVASISKQDGEFLKNESPAAARAQTVEEQDRLAEFSSRGPVTGTWEIKPDIVAPGVAVNSTVPGGYLSLQGTSMAAPHVAGACALIKQAHPDWTPLQIKAALMNTAKPLGKTYHTYEQGAGRIQVDEAVKPSSLVIPSSLKFGKYPVEGQAHKETLTIENTSDETIRYSFDIPESADGLSWRFPLPFMLAPKQKKQVTMELTVNPDEIKGKIQDGIITLNAGAAAIRIPYLYVVEEPNYPRVMGFSFADGDKPNQLKYEVYLPGGAEEFGIALFHADDYRFIGFLDTGRNVKKGMIEKEISPEKLPPAGSYLVKVFAKKAGKEDSLETMITFK